MTGAAPPAQPEVERLTARRDEVRGWWIGESARPEQPVVGLALSGGGIRSATFSLGLLQALARANRLKEIDLLSSVSGGGYIACFLRSLFLPQSLKGIAPSVGDRADSPIAMPAAEAERQYRFAVRALTSEANAQMIDGPDAAQVRNPIWWLREHSRYLAPNNATDYGYALAYLARNWVAMIYIFVVAVALVISAAAILLGLIVGNWPDWIEPFTQIRWERAVDAACKSCCCMMPVPKEAMRTTVLFVSPIVYLAIVPLLAAVAFSVGYWFTEQMSANERSIERQRGNFWAVWIKTLVAMLLLAFVIGVPGLPNLGWTAAVAPVSHRLTAIVIFIFAGALAASLLLYAYLETRLKSSPLLTAELRRVATAWLSTLLGLAVLFFIVGVVDSLGMALRDWFWATSDGWQKLGTGILLPAFAFLLKKIPDWFGKPGGSTLGKLVSRFLPIITLGIGLLLFGAIAVLVDALVQAAAWQKSGWLGQPDWPTLLAFSFVVLVLALLAGRATGFINLSSLHNLYASRLTRAYIGAANADRLRSVATDARNIRVTENHDQDYIQPDIYQRAQLAAPLHIINVTVNQTIDPTSQLVSRDRKGVPGALEPDGFHIHGPDGRSSLAWRRIGDPAGAQAISLGQWCAISGAAASSGMGRLTNLGFAVAMTFANVRLGYWWWAPALRGNQKRNPILMLTETYFPTFAYLFDELTAHYARSFDRLYLSDGGHFENSGALALIRRRVPLIIVSDNGADPDYAYGDLETLVRTARIDTGAEIRLLSGAELNAFRGRYDAYAGMFIDPAGVDWKTKVRDNEISGIALALQVEFAREETDAPNALDMIWIKPRRLADMPPDVTGYCVNNPPFPQQTTGDQFFDEAQWESYRRLGQEMMARLLEGCPRLLT